MDLKAKNVTTRTILVKEMKLQTKIETQNLKFWMRILIGYIPEHMKKGDSREVFASANGASIPIV